MSERAFFDKKAKEEATAAIKAIEAQTSAEVVVTLRHVSGNYRHADYLFGFVLSLLTLIALLFVPWEFSLYSFPIDVALTFAVGAIVCSFLSPLRRLLTSRKQRLSNAQKSARAAFVDLGIARCTGRWGILVYVAMFERTVEVVADIAIDPKTLGKGWDEALAKLRASVADGPDLPRFLEAFRALGPVLSTAFPHRDDDVNELPDEVDPQGEPAEA